MRLGKNFSNILWDSFLRVFVSKLNWSRFVEILTNSQQSNFEFKLKVCLRNFSFFFSRSLKIFQRDFYKARYQFFEILECCEILMFDWKSLWEFPVWAEQIGMKNSMFFFVFQVRDEYRSDFDSGRGGYGKIIQQKVQPLDASAFAMWIVIDHEFDCNYCIDESDIHALYRSWALNSHYPLRYKSGLLKYVHLLVLNKNCLPFVNIRIITHTWISMDIFKQRDNSMYSVFIRGITRLREWVINGKKNWEEICTDEGKEGANLNARILVRMFCKAPRIARIL